jgi:ribosomal-protein-serine acetyltransferase
MNEPQVQPPHEIQTERLILRSARAGDGLALRDAIGVSLTEFYPWLSFSAELSDLEALERVSRLGETAFLEDEFYIWRVWEPDGLLVGSVDLHSFNRAVPSCEIGFWLRTDRTGQGFAQEFVAAAIEIAHKTLNVERIEACCDVRNERSWRLVERLGFAFEGIARNSDRDAAGELCSMKVYGLVRTSHR